MRAYQFPTTCPVCGGTIRTAPDAVENHRSCHQQAYRMAMHADAMRQLAKSWPSRQVIPEPVPRQLAIG